MKWQFWKKTSTNYPSQQLSPQQIMLIEELDSYLLSLNSHPVLNNTSMKIHQIVIPFSHLFLSTEKMLNLMKSQVKTNHPYIPRSVAFIIEADGTWVFLYAMREAIGSNEVCQKMFVECLTRTNNSRNM